MALPSESVQPPPPFPVAHLRLEETIDGHFRPAAFIALSRDLLASGLLARLPAEETKSLLALLAHVSPNGRVRATAAQIAAGLGIHEGQADIRLKNLMQQAWQGAPLVRALTHEGNYTTFSPTDQMIAGSDELVFIPHAEAVARRPLIIRAAAGETVVDYTRKKYGNPKEVVEHQIAEQNDWPLPSSPHPEVPMTKLAPTEENQRRAWDLLVRIGVRKEKASELVEAYPAEQIIRQITWLPHRRPKSPARLIIAAIEQDFEEP